MSDLKIQYLNVNDLIPYINNPRENDHAVDAVASSIKNFGFKNPIVIDEYNEIINGHTRLKAAKKLGMEKVPVIKVTDLSDEQIRAFRIADNKVAEIADWDMELLESELSLIEGIEMKGFGLEDFVFGEDTGEVVEDEFDIDEEIQEEPISKLGQVYQLGDHRLMCGDSTDVKNIQKLMCGEKADLWITDPPYNAAYEGKTGDRLTIKNDSMEDEQFKDFLVDAFKAAEENIKQGAAFYIWHADSEGYNFRDACKEVGLTVRQCLIWNKNSMVMGRRDYHWKHESCLYGWKDGAAHLWNNDRKQTSVLEFDKPTANRLHPTMKPVKLFDYQIKNNTHPGDKVLDTFGGGGTTLIACEQNRRKCYMMELDPKYVDVIIKRWEELTGQKAKLIEE